MIRALPLIFAAALLGALLFAAPPVQPPKLCIPPGWWVQICG